MAFLGKEQIASMGFRSVGENTLLSDKASYYNCKNISIGSNTRIDDFCVLSAGEGGIEIGQHVHIAIGVSIIGTGKVILEDFVGLSSRVSVYSSNDDYSGMFMTGPTIPVEFTNVTNGPVTIGKHSIVGSGTVILPNIVIKEGVAIGALSLVTKDCDEFGIYMGTPAKKIKERKRDLLELEKSYYLSLKKD
ncbi:acyltransferase [Psychrobacter proteolyticus]|uniref:acyltransferase n=1 Tax=Psychrobacter proteolyticus TaxID=147825 RepID=UPI000E09ECC1|nr:acyltransferase [Psychrobacter proteolyticus]